MVAADKLHDSFVAQVWGVSTLSVVIIICPILAILSKNAISSIQVKLRDVKNIRSALYIVFR